jgi:hypothetical protein
MNNYKSNKKPDENIEAFVAGMKGIALSDMGNYTPQKKPAIDDPALKLYLEIGQLVALYKKGEA